MRTRRYPSLRDWRYADEQRDEAGRLMREPHGERYRVALQRISRESGSAWLGDALSGKSHE